MPGMLSRLTPSSCRPFRTTGSPNSRSASSTRKPSSREPAGRQKIARSCAWMVVGVPPSNDVSNVPESATESGSRAGTERRAGYARRRIGDACALISDGQGATRRNGGAVLDAGRIERDRRAGRADAAIRAVGQDDRSRALVRANATMLTGVVMPGPKTC